MMRYLWSIYRTRAAWLFANMLLLAFTWISAIGLLAVSGWFIAACAIFGLGLVAGLNLLTPSTIIRALALSRTFGRYAERVVGHEAILRVLKDLRIRVFNSLIQLHLNGGC
jgi:ATP-binding cassette subfamily C protein CydC